MNGSIYDLTDDKDEMDCDKQDYKQPSELYESLMDVNESNQMRESSDEAFKRTSNFQKLQPD